MSDSKFTLTQIREIYQRYGLPENLCQHQINVAKIVKIITSNWIDPESINAQNAITSAYFHDMGNPIKFRWDIPGLLKGMSVATAKKNQAQMIQKYGSNVHHATMAICQEIGLNQDILNIIDHTEWHQALDLLKHQEWESLVLIYADMRVAPHGVVPLVERITNLAKRCKLNLTAKDYIAIGQTLETALGQRSKLDLI